MTALPAIRLPVIRRLSIVGLSLAALGCSAAPEYNLAPLAHAGDDRIAGVGETLFLSGAASADPEGRELIYEWLIEQQPEEGGAELMQTSLKIVAFRPTKAGPHVIRLKVSDGELSSSDLVEIDVAGDPPRRNHAPVANPGPDLEVAVGEDVVLDGRHSVDVDGDEMTFEWAIVQGPPGSVASLRAPRSAMPTFTPDTGGTYVISLSVRDAELRSQVGSCFVLAQ